MSKFGIKNFKGIVPAILTVFSKNEDIDEVGMRRLVSYLINRGVGGLYLTRSTGEGFTMSSKERKRVVGIIIDENKGRVPVVIHVGAIGTRLSIDLAKHAEVTGADGISSAPPSYWKFNENQIVKYYEEITNSCNLPMIAYNVPLAGLLGMNIIEKLAPIENVKGIKYTVLSRYEITQMKDELGEDFLVYSGTDEMAMSGLLAGAGGIIDSFYNIIPELFIDIKEAADSKNIDEAQKLQRQAVEIIVYSLKLLSFYAGMKAVLGWGGINAGYCRSSFENSTEKEEIEFKEGYKKLKETYNITGIELLDEI